VVRIYLRAVAVVNEAVVFGPRCVEREGVRSQAVHVALVGECTIRVV
jgi:hypothetical protein